MKKSLLFSSILFGFSGFIMMLGGIFGIVYTYQSIASEDVTTTKDSAIPGVPVRGPLTLVAQSDIIRVHMLKSTDNKTFAQMPRTIPQLDEEGNTVLGDDGEAVMVPNELRATWFPAVTLMTALQLGLISYAFSALTFVLGFLFCINAYLFLLFRKQ